MQGTVYITVHIPNRIPPSICIEPPAPPKHLHQDDSAKFETSAVVQWKSPAMTGGKETINEYTVTVDGQVHQTIRYYGGGVFTTIITGLENSTHTVSVTSMNCDLSSKPATTTVFIEARGKWNLLGQFHGIINVSQINLHRLLPATVKVQRVKVPAGRYTCMYYM